MVRAGLGPNWRCIFANDLDPRKAATYRANWGGGDLLEGDVGAITSGDLPGRADLMWGSFPCQDLSVAGAGAGLGGARSSAFFPFWRLVTDLAAEHRAPRIVAIENVRGALTARGGASFAAICAAFATAGYRFGAMLIDAALFVPQSRPRLFIVGAAPDMPLGRGLTTRSPEPPFHPDALIRTVTALPRFVTDKAVWWRTPFPPPRRVDLADLLESRLPSGAWHCPEQTARLLSLMAPIHRAKIQAFQDVGVSTVGAAYRRTRRAPDGAKLQRAEARFDGQAGCLRTAAGGSSRQIVIQIEDGAVRSRLMTPRESARLMGLADDYMLPSRATDAYHLTGDGVVVDVVSYLSKVLFEPLLANCSPVPSGGAERSAVAAIQA